MNVRNPIFKRVPEKHRQFVVTQAMLYFYNNYPATVVTAQAAATRAVGEYMSTGRVAYRSIENV